MVTQEALDAGRRHVVQLLIHPLQAAELQDQFHRRLGADARHAWDVVRSVSLQALDVRLLRRFQAAVPFPHRRLVIQLALPNAVVERHLHEWRYQLQRVGVSGENNGVQPLRLRLAAQGAEYVVSLIPFHLIDGYAERLHQPSHLWELRLQVLGRRGPLCLVVGVRLVSEGGAAHVERDGAVGGVPVGHRPEESVGESVGAAHLLAGGAGGHRLLNGVEGPVDHGVAVHQQQQLALRLKERSLSARLGCAICPALAPSGQFIPLDEAGDIIPQRPFQRPLDGGHECGQNI